MPGLTAPQHVAAEADLAAARTLVGADPGARALAEGASGDVDLASPLAEWLYGRWWTGRIGTARAVAADPPLTPVLEAARRSVAPIEEGWLVLAGDAVRLVCARVRREMGGPPELVQRAADAVAGSSRPGCAPRPGDLVALFAGSGGPDATGAWWWAHTADPVASGAVDRWYVHATAEGAPAVVAATVDAARTAGVVLSLKCPLRPSGFGRRDALVAYLARADRERWTAGVPDWVDAIGAWLGGAAPPLTRGVAPGVAFAEDPGGDTSLGQLRCAQVAAAVVRLRRATEVDLGAALRGVGIDPTRPELARWVPGR